MAGMARGRPFRCIEMAFALGPCQLMEEKRQKARPARNWVKRAKVAPHPRATPPVLTTPSKGHATPPAHPTPRNRCRKSDLHAGSRGNQLLAAGPVFNGPFWREPARGARIQAGFLAALVWGREISG